VILNIKNETVAVIILEDTVKYAALQCTVRWDNCRDHKKS